MLALAILRTGATFVLGWVSASLSCLLVCAVLQVLLSILVVYTTWIEPFRLEVTREKLRSSKMTTAHPLRLLHISDLHIERRTRREQGLLQVVKDLEPDIVALTGDYLNLSYTEDAEAHAEARAVLADLCRCVKGPVYAVTGSLAVDPPAVVPGIFADLPIVWVLDRVEELEIAGRELRIAGLRCTGQRHLDVPRLRRLLGGRSSTAFTLLLYHSPDLMPEAVEAGVDLYLCGHTHGGQIRLPMFGAIVTSSSFWKRYEMGRYDQAGTTMYVSRGVGMEGLGAPRARLLAPPEVTLWELSG